MSARDFITTLAFSGRYHFTTDEATTALGASVTAARAALRRLKSRGEIAEPHRGFHVIVPPEYRKIGCLPGEQFIPQLMQHLDVFYYVALLSAAELYGAAHQKSQILQVMVAKNRRAITCGRVRVQFVARHDLAGTPTMERNTPCGTVRIASAEATALEVVGYADRCGGLDNVATIIAELADVLDSKKVLEVAARSPVAWVQRLGYLLDLTGHQKLAEPLVRYVQRHATVITPLVRRSTAGARRLERWRIAINAAVEPDV